MDKNQLRTILDLMSEYSLDYVKYKEGSDIVEFSKNVNQPSPPVESTQHEKMSDAGTHTVKGSQFPKAECIQSNAVYIDSPLNGTLYLTNYQGESFVKEGDRIEKGETVACVEAMKMINEIASPATGVISRFLVSDRSKVTKGDRIVMIELEEANV